MTAVAWPRRFCTTLTLSPWLSALLGGVIALILRHKRAIWWSMVVVFVYYYLNLGQIWGGFWSEGVFSGSLFSAASTFAAMAFIGAVFTYGMVTILRAWPAGVGERGPTIWSS